MKLVLIRFGALRRQQPPCKSRPQQPGMRNSSRPSRCEQKARKTASTSPHKWARTRTPRWFSSRRSGSEIAAHRSTSTCNSATLRATDSVGEGARTNSCLATSLPRRRVTKRRRAAASSTGEMRSCETGMAIVTSDLRALSVPAAAVGLSKPVIPPDSRLIRTDLRAATPGKRGGKRGVETVSVAKRHGFDFDSRML